VKECSDGYKARDCPLESKASEVECKVYADEKGCTIKTCTNGFSVNYCEQTNCRVTTEKGCDVKTCEPGYTATSCTGAELVECVQTKDELGCTNVICTTGFSTKACPKDVLASAEIPPEIRDILSEISKKMAEEEAAKPRGLDKLIDDISSFFRKIFGGGK